MSKSASQSTYSHGGSSRSPSLTRDQGGAKTEDRFRQIRAVTSIYNFKSLASQEQSIQGDKDVNNKRRDRSRSPTPTTYSRPQHNQDIRLVRTINEGGARKQTSRQWIRGYHSRFDRSTESGGWGSSPCQRHRNPEQGIFRRGS